MGPARRLAWPIETLSQPANGLEDCPKRDKGSYATIPTHPLLGPQMGSTQWSEAKWRTEGLCLLLAASAGAPAAAAFSCAQPLRLYRDCGSISFWVFSLLPLLFFFFNPRPGSLPASRYSLLCSLRGLSSSYHLRFPDPGVKPTVSHHVGPSRLRRRAARQALPRGWQRCATPRLVYSLDLVRRPGLWCAARLRKPKKSCCAVSPPPSPWASC
ncbi:hypothetical protein VTK73DRAFT_6128 [Phialemonium thermophilum]|uniref:Uncharacterized protein n=1 Tax=Phialemonium thermophilum TaxID=223376 RepID=A0ABR3V085_9PEZI